MVAKAPLRGAEEAAREVSGLRGFAHTSCVPRVLEAGEGVLLLPYLEGSVVPVTDAVAVAEVLQRLHATPTHPEDLDAGVPFWESRRPARFDLWAGKVRAYGGILVPRIAEAIAVLPDLLRTGERRLLHLDVQGKNLLRGRQLWALDPIATIGPLACDVAHSVCAVVSASGAAAPVLGAARRLDVDED